MIRISLSQIYRITNLVILVLLAACGTKSPSILTQAPQTTESMTATIIPGIKPTLPSTITPAATATLSSDAEVFHSASPDGRFTITVDTKNFPLELLVTDKQLHTTNRLLLTNRDLNVFEELVWSSDNRFVAVTLYKDSNRPPFPESTNDIGIDESFVFVNIPEHKVVATYNGGSHIYRWSNQNIITLEHAGLNDIFDYYFVDVDCYKQFFEYECLNSELTGNWEFVIPQGTSEIQKWGFEIANPDEIPDDQFFVVVNNKKEGITWRYTGRTKSSYSHADAKEVFWDQNNKSVYFSPIGYDGSTYFYYGLLRMNLSTGEVIETIPNTLKFTEKYYDLSVSPSGNKVVLGLIENSRRKDQAIIVRNLSTNETKKIPFGKEVSINILPEIKDIENPTLTSNAFWSPDESKVVLVNAITDPATWGEKIAANYLLIDLANNRIIPLEQNSTTYYSVFNITNETVSFIDLGGANQDFGKGNTLLFSLTDGKMISQTQIP
jgi:hypothetical protein